MANYTTITSDKNKKEAMKKCLIGGWFGWHHYYVGNILKGVIYSCTFGICGIGWVYDIIKISLGKFKDNTGTYLRQ